MKKIIKNLLNRISMRKKILLAFSVVICIPLLVCFFLINAMRRNVTETALNNLENSMERVEIRLLQIFDSVETISANIAYSGNYPSIYTATYSSDYERVSAIWNNADLSEQISLSDGIISDIVCYVDHAPVLDNGYFLNTPASIKKTDWYTTLASDSHASFWIYMENPRFLQKGSRNLTLIRPIYDQQQFFSALTVLVEQEKLDEILKLENYPTYLLSADKIILSSSDTAQTGLSISEIGLAEEPDGYRFTDEAKSNDYKIISKTFSSNNTDTVFEIVSILPSSTILEETNEAIRTSILAVLIATFLSILFLLLFSNLLTQRLSRLKEDIHKAASGDFSFHPHTDGTDEIAQLSVDFDIMLKNIQELINKVYLAEIKQQKLEAHQKEIQLQVLNTQINPHFLFNSLESIRMKAVSLEQTDLAGAILMVSSLLRKSLYAGSAPIALKEELELAKNYLELQKFRFSDNFEYKIMILCGIENSRLLPFTIQPFLENAFRHGFENTDFPRRNQYITITIMEEENFLTIRITDNGSGISPQKLAELQKMLHDETTDSDKGHIGIANVHRRIQLTYGKKYGVSITSELFKGTVVTIYLPKA